MRNELHNLTDLHVKIIPEALPKEIIQAGHPVALKLVKSAGSVDVLESLVAKLASGSDGKYAEALQLLTTSLRARGGEVMIAGASTFRGKRADPQIVLTCGEFKQALKREEVIEFFCGAWSNRKSQVGSPSAVLESDLRFACCAIPFSPHEILAVVVWGDNKASFDDLTMLRIFARLLGLLLRECYGKDQPWSHPTPLSQRSLPIDYVEGISDGSAALHHELRLLSEADFPVIVLGETGAGKELIARLLHTWSKRGRGPFIAINCAAIPTELLEAEMFGIGKGVATGVSERKGFFQLADGGTLFLDEISEMRPELQAKLLRVLQDKVIRAVGGATIKVDVRVISATNADLRRRVEEGKFRADLFYRIAGFELRIPPLRERKDDLPLFIEHYLKLYSKEAHKNIRGISLTTLERLIEYSWPGNIRELAQEMRRLVFLCRNNESINSALLSNHIAIPASDGEKESALISTLLLKPNVADLERRMIRRALIIAGNQSRAARLLGISRYGLMKKLQRLGIKV